MPREVKFLAIAREFRGNENLNPADVQLLAPSKYFHSVEIKEQRIKRLQERKCAYLNAAMRGCPQFEAARASAMDMNSGAPPRPFPLISIACALAASTSRSISAG